MTRDQLIKLVLTRLGQRQNDTKLQEAAVAEQQLLQYNQMEGANFKPWFLLSEYEQTTVPGNDYKVSLPTRFLEEWEEGSLWLVPDPVNDPNGRVAVPKGDYDYLAAKYPGVGALRGYSIAGTYFLLSPKPDSDLTLQMRYYKREVLMDDAYGLPAPVNPENKWTKYAADWYMAELGFLLAKHYTRDEQAALRFESDLVAAKARIYTETIARQEANQNREMGVED